MTELVLFNPKNINIPTKKLNSMQLKQYQAYAADLVKEIEGYIDDIKSHKINKFERENEEQIEEEIIKKQKIDKLAVRMNQMLQPLFEQTLLIIKRNARYHKEIRELEDKYSADCTEMKAASNKLNDTAKKEYDKIEKEVADKDIDLHGYSAYFSINHDGTFMVNRSSINEDAIFDNIKLKESNLIDSSVVSDELRRRVEPIIKEWVEKEQAIDDLKVSTKEILMFDETKINEVFEQLITFRNAVKAERRKIDKETKV